MTRITKESISSCIPLE